MCAHEIPRRGSETARVALDRSGSRLATVISQTRLGAAPRGLGFLDLRRKISSAPLNTIIRRLRAVRERRADPRARALAGTAQKPRHDLVVFAADTGAVLWRRENISWDGGLGSSEAWIVESARLVTLLEQPSNLVPGRFVAWDLDTGEERFALPIGLFARGRPLAAGDHVALAASSTGFTIVSARGGARALPPD